MIGDEVIIDGLRLAVRHAGDGRPFLFIHGLCGDAGQTQEVFPEVAVDTRPDLGSLPS